MLFAFLSKYPVYQQESHHHWSKLYHHSTGNVTILVVVGLIHIAFIRKWMQQLIQRNKKLNKLTALLHTLPFMTWATLFFLNHSHWQQLKSFLDDPEMCMEESNACHLPFATTSQNIVQEWGRGSSQFTHMQKKLAENQCNRLKGLECWACYPYAGPCASLIVPTCSTSLFQQLFWVTRVHPGFTLGNAAKAVKRHALPFAAKL